jgi:gamma-glutamyl:cysteine ligase YbdK (ATP-grasp superfamily)
VAPPFALGVEEELLLLNSDRGLLERGEEIAQQADPDEGQVVGEVFKAMVESNSEISSNAREATTTLRDIRRELLQAGSRLMGVGGPP